MPLDSPLRYRILMLIGQILSEAIKTSRPIPPVEHEIARILLCPRAERLRLLRAVNAVNPDLLTPSPDEQCLGVIVARPDATACKLLGADAGGLKQQSQECEREKRGSTRWRWDHEHDRYQYPRLFSMRYTSQPF